jgi:hypothetical protein
VVRFLHHSHEEIGVRGRHLCAHGCTIDLGVVLAVEFKIVEDEDKFEEFNQVFGWYRFVFTGVPYLFARCNPFTVWTVRV